MRPVRAPACPADAGRAGVILPAALFLLLGGTMIAASLLVVVRSAVLVADGDRRLAESLARRVPDPPAADDPGWRTLGDGYLLHTSEVDEVQWAVWSLWWEARPSRVARGLRAVVETGGGLALEGGVVNILEGCPDLHDLPVHREEEGVRLPLPEPALPPFPRFGPLGLEALRTRADRELLPGVGLPEGPALLFIPATAVVDEGASAGLLVALEDLRLHGDAAFDGLVLVGGDLELSGSALLRGAVKVGGEARVRDGAALLGCRSLVDSLLAEVPTLGPPFSVPGGGFLGRY